MTLSESTICNAHIFAAKCAEGRPDEGDLAPTFWMEYQHLRREAKIIKPVGTRRREPEIWLALLTADPCLSRLHAAVSCRDVPCVSGVAGYRFPMVPEP
jgi:hypothetical protein